MSGRAVLPLAAGQGFLGADIVRLGAVVENDHRIFRIGDLVRLPAGALGPGGELAEHPVDASAITIFRWGRVTPDSRVEIPAELDDLLPR